MANREILLEKFLSGELSETESNEFAQHYASDPTFRSEAELDRLIHSSLVRDAQIVERFSTIPPAFLASQLATHTATTSLIGIFSGKLALTIGGALLIGTAAYVAPKFTRQPQPTLPVAAPRVTVPIISSTNSIPSIGPVQQAARPAIHKHPTPPKLHLDEGDDKNAPTYTDPHLQPPLH